MNTIYISAPKYKELSEKLLYLKKDKAKEIADELEIARAHGDLSENAEYKIAKENQTVLMRDIEVLEDQLERCQIVKSPKKDGTIFVGNFATVLFVSDKMKETFELCGIFEAEPKKNKISNESPIGKALFGKKKGDKVSVVTPDGSFMIEVLDVK